MHRALFWLLAATTAAVYAAMPFWSLPGIAEAAGGLMPFDLRPLGYTPAEARAFLSDLSDDGRDFYLTIQHRLDLAFPALLAATLAWIAFRLNPPGWRAVRWTIAAAALFGMFADYAENAAVAALLSSPPDAVTDAAIAAASRWTVLKSLGATLAMTLAVILILRAAFARSRLHERTDSMP